MRLPELLDMAIVQKLADANFVANGMPLGIIDAHDGAVLVGRGWQDICTQFHRVHPDSARRCRESDEYIKDHLSESAACEYTCKNGLRDIGVPIVVSGEHVATLFLGQFFYEGESPDRGFFMRQARAFGFDQDSYLAALDRVPSFSRRSVEDVVEYDRALARFIADLAESALRHERDRQALRDSESRFRGLAEAMPQLVWVAGAEGNASYLNPSWTDYTGGGGRAAQERMELVHPDDRGRVAECWRAATRAGTGFACEHRLRRHDGVYRWFLTRSTVTRSEAGEVRWIGTATDIHDLKRADEELAVLTGLYAILSEVNEAIVRTRDERSLYEDVCRIIMQQGGLPLVWIGLVRGREIAPVACRGPAADYLREIRVEVDGELGNGPTGTCVREDRPVINDDFDRNPRTSPWRAPALRHGLRASAAFPLHRQGRVIGALTLYAVGAGAFTPEQIKLLEALCADVSYALDSIEQERLRTKAEDALRESERNLRDTDRRKDEFLGVLSHELRNPLAPIRNALYLLDRAPAGGEQASGAKAVIARQVDHLARLVDDLLDVTRISRGKIQLQRSRFDLVEVVERTVEDHRRLLAAREISLDADLGPGPLPVHADHTRIAQVVSNLLQNGEKFTDPGGRITVTVEREGASASIRVADTGIGISPEMLGCLFEPFTQAEKTLHRSRGGLGLGLSLVKALVEMHGGTVEVRSAGSGLGSEFTVRLPLDLDAGEAPHVTAARSAAPRARRVLVIEDNLDAGETLCEVLRMEGHEVVLARDGVEGVAQARALRPEIILCDIGLPGMDGYEVARSIRSDATLASTKLVALTGYALPEDQRRAAEAGFDEHVAKPVPLERIERLLLA